MVKVNSWGTIEVGASAMIWRALIRLFDWWWAPRAARIVADVCARWWRHNDSTK